MRLSKVLLWPGRVGKTVVLSGLLAFNPCAYAESPIRIEVRTIRADGGAETSEARAAVPIDSSISDLSSQLQRLHFTSFKMVDLQSLIIPPRKRVKIELSEGQQLTVRPVLLDGNQLCLWLRWRDREGVELLETRLRFSLGQSVLAGTEHAPNKGLILALRAEAVEE